MSNTMARTGSPLNPRIPRSFSRSAGIHRIAMIGNHLPRQCGIATFTADLNGAISTEFNALDCFVLAMNDEGMDYPYPPQVRLGIDAADFESYNRAAGYLNEASVDMVSLQHEFGIFGGRAGSHILSLLRNLRMPVVTTLHTILARPDPDQFSVMKDLSRISERLVVMSSDGAELLSSVYGVPESRIDIISHGIPSLPSSRLSRKLLGVEGKSVILTFGLLSEDKGIEYVIDAMPAIIERFPDTIYVVLGVTHPHVRKCRGEAYRDMLEARSWRLGVQSHIDFHNRFVSQKELNEYLAAADIYITPYLNPAQSTSGTLAYAVGSGKAVISTPYLYARDILSDGRGILVPWPEEDPLGITRAVTGILGDDSQRAVLCERGAAFGRSMLWPEVARSYFRCFEKAYRENKINPEKFLNIGKHSERDIVLPEIKIDHLKGLSDQTGILQHASFSIPNYEYGYCLDDNARALLLTAILEKEHLTNTGEVRSLAVRYMAFIKHAFNKSTGQFRNFMSYSRKWLEETGSEDSHGRALWALGSAAGWYKDSGRRDLAEALFRRALGKTADFTSPRAWAYTLLGIDGCLQVAKERNALLSIRSELAERLLRLYQKGSCPEWMWFEDNATYCNARLSQALIISGLKMNNKQMKTAGLKSLEWLFEVQSSRAGEGYFVPIGSNGFYKKDGVRAEFDQQPVEACSMVSACISALHVSGNTDWSCKARCAFNWFLGYNGLGQSLYDPVTGGCRDGLHPDRPNENQGAESTLSFLMALAEMNTSVLSAESGSTSTADSSNRETPS